MFWLGSTYSSDLTSDNKSNTRTRHSDITIETNRMNTIHILILASISAPTYVPISPINYLPNSGESVGIKLCTYPKIKSDAFV